MNHNSNDRNSFRDIGDQHNLPVPSSPRSPAGGSTGQLAQIAASLTQGGGLADLHCPKAQREARRRFRQAKLEHVTQVAINEIRSVAEVQAQQISLRAAQRQAELVTAENASLGQLEREQQRLAALAMGAVIEGDTRRQDRVRSADLLPEDRELLERMNQLRARQQIREIAEEHGVRFDDSQAPDEYDQEDDHG